jgi:AcrR family transcriptional regulator
MKSEAKTSRDQQKEETRQRVFEAALAVFRRDGAEPARIEDIAQAAGVSRGTFYFHFPTKEDVLEQVLANAEQHLVAQLEVLPATAPMTDILTLAAKTVADQWETEPRLFMEVGVVALRRIAARGPQLRDPVRNTLARRFARAAASGELVSALPPEILADVYLLNVFAAALAWCNNPIVSLRAILEGVTALFLHGAAGQPPAA